MTAILSLGKYPVKEVVAQFEILSAAPPQTRGQGSPRRRICEPMS